MIYLDHHSHEDTSILRMDPGPRRASSPFQYFPSTHLMAAHVVHRLPWASFCDVAMKFPLPGDKTSNRMTDAEKKQMRHFARCLADALQEFKDTDRSTDEERARYDPTNWRNTAPYSRHFLPGYYSYLLWGYIELNLLIIDSEAFQPRMMPRDITDSLYMLLGHWDGSCPEELASQLRPAFDDNNRLKPVTSEVIQVLRNHAARVFRCMYNIGGKNEFLDREELSAWIIGYFYCINKRGC